jgi:hypothetical protein
MPLYRSDRAAYFDGKIVANIGKNPQKFVKRTGDKQGKSQIDTPHKQTGSGRGAAESIGESASTSHALFSMEKTPFILKIGIKIY